MFPLFCIPRKIFGLTEQLGQCSLISLYTTLTLICSASSRKYNHCSCLLNICQHAMALIQISYISFESEVREVKCTIKLKIYKIL